MTNLSSTNSDIKSKFKYINLPVDRNIRTVDTPIKGYRTQVTAVPSGYTTIRHLAVKHSSYQVWIPRKLTNFSPSYSTSTRHLKELRVAEYSLVFNNGISLEVEFDESDDMSTVYSEAFGIYGSGETEHDALDDFCQSFIEFYCNIVESPDSELGASTKKFKRTLKSFAKLRKRV